MTRKEPDFSTQKKSDLIDLIEEVILPQRLTLNGSQPQVSNETNVRINNIVIPEGQTLRVWAVQSLAGRGGAEVEGAIAQIVEQGDVLFEKDSGDIEGIDIDSRNPIFTYEGNGEFLIFRVRNETGGDTNISGFFNISIGPQ